MFAVAPLLLALLGLSLAQSGVEPKAEFPPFGRAMRQEFLFDPNFISLNHGAYGTYPKYVQTAYHAFQARSEANSDLWIRRDARTELDKIRKLLADFISANATDIVMIPNATSGMNAIFRSFPFQPFDQILHFSTIYNSMLSIIRYIGDINNGTVTALQFNVTYPISNDLLLEKLEAFVDAHHTPQRPIRMALIDHISSSPASLNPIDKIIPMLHKRNITVLIDGAHAIGQVPVNLTQLSPDYYITNCHKWLYAPRGCSLMYVDSKLQDIVHPAHIGSNYRKPSRFQDEFFWTGTMDYSSYMSVTAALEFRKLVGGEEVIRNYTHNLALEGGKFLARRFGTELLQEEEQFGSMVDVRLPINQPDSAILTADWWIDTLLYKYNVYASPIYHAGSWYARISAQIYNDMDDFEAAAQTFLSICNEINSGNATAVVHRP